MLWIALACFLVWQVSPVHADEPAATLAPLSVSIVEAERGAVTQWLFAEGVVQAARKEFLRFQQSGRVIEVARAADGAELRAGIRVQEGTVLARLDPRDAQNALDRAKAEVVAATERARAARIALDQARADFDRQRQLVDRGTVSRARFEATQSTMRTAEANLAEARATLAVARSQVSAAEIMLDRTELRAPFDGVISLINVQVGDNVADTPVETDDIAQERGAALVLIDDSRFDITLHLPPFEADQLIEGQSALVSNLGTAIAEYLRGRDSGTTVLHGELWSVSPSISLQRRAVTVVVRVDAGEGVLRDGSFVSVWIATASADAVVRVPYDAVIQREDVFYGFIVDVENVAHRRDLQLGLGGLDFLHIIDGLSEGERIVVEGQHRLSDGAPVRIVGDER